MTRRYTRIRACARVVLAFGIILLAGCVSKEVEPPHQPRLVISQAKDGVVTLSWNSEVGYKYAIDYMDPQDKRWKPLPGKDAFRGTGETISVRQPCNPQLPTPWFNIRYSKD